MSQTKTRTVIAWVFQILSAVPVLGAAVGKLLSTPGWVGRFSNWGYPDGFYFVVGVLEVVGVVALLIPRTAGRAAAGLLVIMIAALLTHLVNGEGIAVVRPLIVIVLLAPVLWLRGFASGWRPASRPMPSQAATAASRRTPGE
jgi:putative oxidoreductase